MKICSSIEKAGVLEVPGLHSHDLRSSPHPFGQGLSHFTAVPSTPYCPIPDLLPPLMLLERSLLALCWKLLISFNLGILAVG